MSGMGERPEGTTGQPAGTLRVVSSERSMKTYIVTDSELRNITLANGIAGLCFTFMAGLWGYAFSMSTDLMFDSKPSAAAIEWSNALHPICVYGGVAFLLFGIAMMLWRHFMINLIKRENSPNARTARGWWGRVWDAIRS